MKDKPKVGDILYSLNIGNAAGRGAEQKLTPVTVAKVARKYFYCLESEYRENKAYHLSDWRQKGDWETSELYESPQAWEDEKERAKLYLELDNHGYGKLSLKQLKQIEKIIKEND